MRGEERRRLLPARLMMYFVLALWLLLSDGTYLAQLRPARKADGPPIIVRVIEYTVHTTPTDPTTDATDAATTTSEVFALVTDLLDAQAYPALDLACAYPMRWGAETVIGHHKTDMGPGMPVLRSKNPEGLAQQMWALFAVYQATAQLIGAGADATGHHKNRSASATPSPPRPTPSRRSPLRT
jgi:hypothetical protein